jgi:hypothetical protein
MDDGAGTDDGAGIRNVFNIDMVNLLGVFFFQIPA